MNRQRLPKRKYIGLFGGLISLVFSIQDSPAAEIAPLTGGWKHTANECTNFSNASTWAADCAVLDGGTWSGSGTANDPFRCEDPSHPRPWSSEAIIEPLASARSGGSASLQAWQTETSSVHCTGVFDTGTMTKTLGVESGNAALMSINGNAGSWGATRARDVNCPSGSWTLADRCLQHPVADPYRAFNMCPNTPTNPVNVFTGAKIHTETDFHGDGPNPLVLKRFYSTRTAWRHAPWESSGFGVYWRHNYSRAIEHFNNDTFEAVTVYLGNGNRHYFIPQIEDDVTSWVATEPDITSVLTVLSLGGEMFWDLHKPDGSRERYLRSSGVLDHILSREGFRTSFDYDEQLRLARVANDFGRSLVFNYADSGLGAGLITSVALYRNGEIVPESELRYGYENTNPAGHQLMLDKVIYSDETPEDASDNLFKDYLYNEPEHIYFDEAWIVDVEDGPSVRSANYPTKLTGIIDENGARFATYKYQRVLFDGGHRFLLPVWGGHGAPNEDGKYANAYKITRYQPTGARADSRSHQGYATIKDALGTERQFHFKNYAGILRPTEIFGGKCELCGSDSQQTTYDTSGFINSRIDFAGNRTVYQRNEFGLDICRIEGVSTIAPEKNVARRVVTQWQNESRVMRLRKIYQPSALADLSTCNAEDDTGWTLRYEITHAFDESSGRIESQTRRSFDEFGEQDELPRVTSFSYYGADEQGGLPHQLRQIDGPREDVSDTRTFRYAVSFSDAHAPGDLIEIENALGHILRINKHDKFGRPLETTDSNGSKVVLSYYPRGWLKSRSVDGHETSYEYDGLGQVLKVTFPNGRFITHIYDQAHRLTEITDNLGNRIHYTLDLMGNRIAEKIYDSSGVLKKHTKWIMNGLNQVEKKISVVDEYTANVTGFLYDANGLLQRVVDSRDPEVDEVMPLPNSPTVFSEVEYDALNRISITRDNEGGTTAYTYDVFDQITTITEPDDGNTSTPQGLTTQYSYNSFGDLEMLISPDTGTSKYHYDLAGNRITMMRATDMDLEREVSYQYDALNRLRFIDYDDETIDTTYLYDGVAENQNGIGRITRIVDGSGDTSLFYDKRGNTEKVSTARDGIVKDTTFIYDAANQLLMTNTPGGKEISYFYQQSAENGGSNWLSKVEVRGGGIDQVFAHTINYLPFGPLTGWTYGNDIVSSREFDLSYRVKNLSHTGISAREYSLDAVDNILQSNDSLGGGYESNYMYDHLNRLTEAGIGSSTYSYSYDSVGNRVSATSNLVQQPYLYKTSSHHLNDVGGYYSYDLNGNIDSGGGFEYEYGNDNRMKRASETNGSAVSYQHNALGQRTEKASAQKTSYYYDLQGRLIEETDKFGNTALTYIHLFGYPLGLIKEEISPFDDTDTDGMLNGFEWHYGFDSNDISDASVDYDQDGHSNLIEHNAETDPTDPFSFPHASNTPVKQVPAFGYIAGIIAAILIMATVLPYINSAPLAIALVLLFSWMISESTTARDRFIETPRANAASEKETTLSR